MAQYKNVKGKRVRLTPEEEAALVAKRVAKEQARSARKQEKTDKLEWAKTVLQTVAQSSGVEPKDLNRALKILFST